MRFERTARCEEMIERLRAFIDDRVRSAEAEHQQEMETLEHGLTATMKRLQDEAKVLGLWNLSFTDPSVGAGLSFSEYAPLAELMGTCRLATQVTNCDPPTNINAEAMLMYADAEQRELWLDPMLEGSMKSAFAMTEPTVGSSDASNIALRAVKDGDTWVLNGRKWWISGVLNPACGFLMTVASTDPNGSAHRRHTQFIVPRDAHGLSVERNLSKFGYVSREGHVELMFDNVRVPEANILGDVGGGFAIGQARLGSARVQHCMRTIGLAELALSLMCERADSRTTFGALVSARSNIQDWIAESRIELDAARLLTLRTAWLMDKEGNKAAAPEMSVIKVKVMETAYTIIDRAIQVHGAAGVSEDTPLAEMFADIRSLRIADGPDEVHKMAIAKRELRRQAASRAEMAEVGS